MKTPLNGGDELIRAVLLEQRHLEVTHLHFIPIGDSAYSYRVMTHSDRSYYLKLVDQRTARGRRIAAHMNFSLPLQRLVVEHQLAEVTAPLPQPTINGVLCAMNEAFLFALYTFIHGDTFADAYPMSPTLVQQIGQALAALHTIQIPEALQERSPQDSLTAPFDVGLLADVASLEAITSQDALYLQRLREVVWPRREQIRAFLAHSQQYARKAHQTPVSPVTCHGDAWGGNMIMSPSGQLTLLDWESAVMAPPERDAFKYIGYFDSVASLFTHGLRNEMQKKKQRALQTRLILWLVRRSGRSISPESKDEIQKDGQDSKQHDEENRDEAHKRGVGNDDYDQHKHQDQRKQGQDKAWSIAHLIGRFTRRLFFKLRVLLRHSETSRVVTLFFFPLISLRMALQEVREAGKPPTINQDSYEAASQAISAECMSCCAFRGLYRGNPAAMTLHVPGSRSIAQTRSPCLGTSESLTTLKPCFS